MQADYVIVGAGSAGCVLANRLTEDPATRVILIEAGGRDWNPLIHIPVGYMKLLDQKQLNASWRHPRSRQKSTTAVIWAASPGSLVVRSLTSSTPISSPLPRTSPTT